MHHSARCPPSSWWSLWPTLDSPRTGGWREAEGGELSPAAVAWGRWLLFHSKRGVRTGRHRQGWGSRALGNWCESSATDGNETNGKSVMRAECRGTNSGAQIEFL